MGVKGRFDRILEALADPYRREPLLALLQLTPQDDAAPDPVNIPSGGEENLPQLNIVVEHRPQLEEIGIIDRNQETDEITIGSDWEEFEPLLRLIAENKDKLPAQWFEEGDSE